MQQITDSVAALVRARSRSATGLPSATRWRGADGVDVFGARGGAGGEGFEIRLGRGAGPGACHAGDGEAGGEVSYGTSGGTESDGLDADVAGRGGSLAGDLDGATLYGKK